MHLKSICAISARNMHLFEMHVKICIIKTSQNVEKFHELWRTSTIFRKPRQHQNMHLHEHPGPIHDLLIDTYFLLV